MKADVRLLQVGALGAGLAGLMLASMALLPLPTGLTYPGRAVLTGDLVLAPADWTAYVSVMQMQFILDGFFVVGWLLAWVGIAAVVLRRAPLLGGLTLFFGVAGALLDLAENSIIWAVLQTLAAGQPADSAWFIPWAVVHHLSYWLPLAGAVLAAGGLWSADWLDRLAAVIGTVLVAVAAAGLYLPVLAPFTDIWFFLWFACCGLLLWRGARLLAQAH